MRCSAANVQSNLFMARIPQIYGAFVTVVVSAAARAAAISITSRSLTTSNKGSTAAALAAAVAALFNYVELWVDISAVHRGPCDDCH